jgi:hypothetical protein
VELIFVDQSDEPRPVVGVFPQPAGYGAAPERPELHRAATNALRRAVVSAMPEGTREVELICTALGTRLEITATVDGHQWIPAQGVVDALRSLRIAEYDPSTGAWTTARYRLEPLEPAGGDYRTGYDSPQWIRAEAEERAYHDELRYFPRRTAPEWLLEPAWRYHEEAREPRSAPERLRMAQVFDGRDAENRPVVYRPVLSWADKKMVLDYLSGGQFLLAAAGVEADELDAQRPAVVPEAYHTDGVWVWPLAIEYYLRVHDVAPERDFVDHIRRNQQPPEEVAEYAIEAAKTVVVGPGVPDLAGPRIAEAIELAKGFISAMGMSRRFYSFEQPLEGGWSMLREADGWWSVFRVDGGKIKSRSRFPDPFGAAAHLIGAMALTRDRFLRAPDEPLADFECPIKPLPGERPLDTYDNKFLVDLRAGDEVDRFGDQAGNTVFVAGTTLPQRSAPPQQPAGDYRRYRVLTGFQVISGVVKPDFGQVGGGTAFVLPADVQTLINDGWLTEV